MSSLLRVEPFSIVTVPYRDLRGSPKTNPDGSLQFGLFMVVSIYSDETVLACKITSNEKYVDSFSIELDLEEHNFLKTPSFLLLSKPQCFSLSSCRVLGSVNPSLRRLVSSRFNSLVRLWTSSLYSNSPAYVSPNKRR